MRLSRRGGLAAAILGLLVLAIALGVGLANGSSRSVETPSGRQDCRQVTPATCELAHALGRGINLGNMLEAPREGDWGLKLEPAYIDLAARNFRTVRLPVRWSNHAARSADATIDEAFARRVDQAVDALLARGVYVILNVHHYNQLSGDDLHRHEFRVEPAVVEARFINLWRQIAQRYKDRPNRLVFELLNEPNGRLDGEPWNRLAAQALAVVRESNPDRAVMIGPGGYNHVRELPRLRLPKDRNLIVPVHLYDPFDFTHQGVTWRPQPMPKGIACCDAGQRRTMTEVMERASRWNREHGVPMHLGEFGVFHEADGASRAAWARHMRDEAERRGIGWTWWSFSSDFGVWSAETRGWVEPLRQALLD
ncbi:glycoside hydrolase family 5 protein [Ramlibacter sp. AW1]|uniref:Glycoside hydrolase family 5 protein n=1 Tax=Ramlibacter aurantiacus TaxID=2801330 RepID=A0A936ZSK8_9BURK|nr:glycoside hydrolase family 5 protein [Ramlibacter aurantiacus]MBL0422926.1 glycoside hydrolase family 5 protein [Ramlibacter aurantiacus]